MRPSALLLGIVFYAAAGSAYAVPAPPEVAAIIRSSPLGYSMVRGTSFELLGKIQAGKRRFWVIETRKGGLKDHQGIAIRASCYLVFLEEKAKRPSYLGFYGTECESFRVRGHRVEYWMPKPDGTPRWLGFTLTEKGPPPGLFDSPEFFPFRRD